MLVVVFVATSGRNVIAANTDCSGVNFPTADCPDVPADGINYSSIFGGVTEVNVGDGNAGTTIVNPAIPGIWLTQYAPTGNVEPDTSFALIQYDIDPTAAVDNQYILSADGATPLMSGSNYIIANGGTPPLHC